MGDAIGGAVGIEIADVIFSGTFSRSKSSIRDFCLRRCFRDNFGGSEVGAAILFSWLSIFKALTFLTNPAEGQWKLYRTRRKRM